MEKPDTEAVVAFIHELFGAHIEAYTDKHGDAPPCIYVAPKLRRLFVGCGYEYQGIPLVPAEGINSITLCSPAPFLPGERYDPWADGDNPDPLFGGEGNQAPEARWRWRDFLN